jgi:hypothetical protein
VLRYLTEIVNLQRICNDLILEKAEQNKQISMLNNQVDRKNQLLLQDAPPGALRGARRSSLPGAQVTASHTRSTLSLMSAQIDFACGFTCFVVWMQDDMEMTKLRSKAADLASKNEALAKELLSMKGRNLQLVKERDEARQIAESLHDIFSDLLANHNMIMPSAHEPTGDDSQDFHRIQQYNGTSAATSFYGDDLQHRIFHGPTSNMNREVSPSLSGTSCGSSRFSQGSHVSRTADGRPVSRPIKLQRPKVLPGDDGDYSSDCSASLSVCSDP